jgi:hypothetical protein
MTKTSNNVADIPADGYLVAKRISRQNKPLVYIRARRFTTCPECKGSVTPGQIIERESGGHKKCPPPLPWLS